ncbi:PREDICTED: U-box domain-containing protein 52-like [Tarenaya hassleriana]|uniref:U-box domain-containing protein 52-like n=1 Tax=Tarenaya hassleriana TaxID=28532 RepID=UPI00053C7912|nr:PREDICTED: U-box domain-containing protein 52-like [Tarenaya hassleriana]
MEDQKMVVRSLSEHLGMPSKAVAIAISGKKKSKYIVFWALEKFIPDGVSSFKLLYVRPPILTVPTPMGNAIPISDVRDDVALAYKQEVEWNTSEMLRPYKKMCERRKVQVEVMVLESQDTVGAIAEEMTNSGTDKLVIGLSMRGFFSRKIDMSLMIAAATPRFCTVYVVSKGKLASVRPSDSDTNGTIRYVGTERSGSTSGSPRRNTRRLSEIQELASFASDAQSRVSAVNPDQEQEMLPEISNVLFPVENGEGESDGRFSLETFPVMSWSSRWREAEERGEILSSTASNNYELANIDWGTILPDSFSSVSHQPSFMSEGLLSVHSFTDNQVNLNFEIEKLNVELKRIQEMYAMAQTETVNASEKVGFHLTFVWMQLEERELRRKEEEEEKEKEKEEAEKVKEQVVREALKRREAEIKAEREAREKEKLQLALVTPPVQYHLFTWDEIVAATSNFSEELQIGKGAYGTVFKCNLHHTMAAVKVLHAGESQLSKQFDQELEILSKIRHPHLVLLLGACPERGCLVYEYMENGSLEDRLMLVNGTPPIPWFDRFRVAWEVASGLVFLHKSRPKPIIHRDLKPANILLDHNFVSKLGDVGLSTMVNQDDPSSKLTVYKDTSPVGTLCYIDPEYQRSGIISPKSDVYSLGVVILQLMTAKPAIAVTHLVEEAIGDDAQFMEVLDAKAGEWPINETRELAALALWCTELRRRDRPDLKDQILPTLERLRKFADKAAQSSLLKAMTRPPSHFICPLLMDVMKEPCVAADGYTYDRQAIEEWLRDHDASPVTKLPLPSKNLLPNYTLHAAIVEWKSQKK